MTLFSQKTNIGKSLLLLSLATTIISCSSGVEEENPITSDNEAITSRIFNYSKLNISSNKEEYGYNDVAMATGKNFNIEICFNTEASRSLKHTKIILTDATRKLELMTDSNSCVFFDEFITLNYNTKRQLETYHLNFKSELLGKSLDVKFQIDPHNEDLFDLGKTQFEETKQKTTKSNEDDGIIMGKISVTPKGYGKIDPRNDNFILDKPFEIRTSIFMSANGQRLRNEMVDVRLTNKETNRTTLKEGIRLKNGELTVGMDMLYNRYSNTRRIEFDLEVNSRSAHIDGMSTKRSICLYPWTNSGWSFVHDTIAGPCPKDENHQRARLYIDEANYTFLGHDQEQGFHLNKDLDLVTIKSYVVNIRPRVDYGNFIHHINPTEPLYKGKFRLKIILYAPKENRGDIQLTAETFKHFRPISTASTEVFVQAEKLIARIDMPISFSDLPYVHTRTFAVLRLEAIDNDNPNAPLPSTSIGVFHASSKTFRSEMLEKINLEEVSANKKLMLEELKNSFDTEFKALDKINFESEVNPIARQQLKLRTTEASDKKFIKKSNNDDLMLPYKNITQKELIAKTGIKEIEKELLMLNDYNRETMKKLCALVFDKNDKSGYFEAQKNEEINYKECLKTPELFMQIRSFEHVRNITSRPKVKFSETLRINTSTGSNNFHGTSDRVSTSRRISFGGKAGLKIDLPLIFGAGLDVGFDISKMWGHDSQIGSSNRSDVGSGIDLQADALTLQFNAYTKRCLTVDSTIYLKREISFKTNSSPSGFGGIEQKNVAYPNNRRFRLCEDEASEKSLVETWYYIGEGHQFHTILRDRQNILENKYTILIRGKKNMANFIEFLHNNHKSIFLKKVKRTLSPSHYLSGAYEGFKDNFTPRKNNVFDGELPGTIELYNAIHNGGDQYYGELPVRDFKVFSSPWGKRYE